MKEVFTSAWFWLAAFAYMGANWGGYIASKDERYKPLGGIALIVKLSLYVFVALLFWRLDKWYYPAIVFAALFLFDTIVIKLHSLIHIVLRKETSALEYRILGIIGTWGGLVLSIFAYVSLFKLT